jgi:hypothetical protein
VYALLGGARNTGCLFDEKAGHRPPPEIVSLAFDWMDRLMGADAQSR